MILKNIVVTGGTGYLGHKVVTKLIEYNYTVVCVVVSKTELGYLKPVVDRVQLITTENPNFEEEILQFSPDAVIHMAAVYDRGTASLSDLLNANLNFPCKLLDTIAQMKKKCYWLNTDTALDLEFNRYSLSKGQFSQWGRYYAHLGEISFINLQLQQFYGPKDSGAKFFPFLLDKLKKNESIDLTAGNQKRDIIYIDDVVEAYLFLLSLDFTGYQSIPLGTGTSPSIRETVEYLSKLLNSSSCLNFGAVPVRTNEPENLVADITMLNHLGFFCKYTWQEGLKKMVEED